MIKLPKGDKAYRIAVTVLTITAVVLGILIAKDRGWVNLDTLIKRTTEPENAPTPASQVDTPASQVDINFSEMPNPESVLVFPAEDASVEEKEKHGSLVRSLAKEGDSVNITGCTAEPMVLRVNENSEFSFENNDEVPHTIKWADVVITVSSGEKKQVNVSDIARYGLGDYGYTCDDNLSGILNVTP